MPFDTFIALKIFMLKNFLNKLYQNLLRFTTTNFTFCYNNLRHEYNLMVKIGHLL